MITEVLKALDYSDSIIISPDFDGLLSAAIIKKYKDVKISGIYTLNRLFMLDDSNPLDAVWVDHDIRDPRVVSIGCHAVYPEISVNPLSFNPHRIYNQHPDKSFKGKGPNGRDKFPFSTSVLLAHAYKWYPEDIKGIMFLAHADSGYKVFNDYFDNVKGWSDVFYDENLRKIKDTNPEPIYNDLKMAGYRNPDYQKPSVYVSSESKYIDNIRQMSNYINDYIKMPEIKDIVSTTKFALKGHEFSGKVDSHTLGVVDKSLSYAVIYKRQISYTVGNL